MAGDSSRRKDSPANDGHAVLQDVDSADESTDTEEAVRDNAVRLNLKKGMVGLHSRFLCKDRTVPTTVAVLPPKLSLSRV